MTTIPLFPLGAVLFPHGRMPLQIFEARYLDLITDCLKNDSGFGVVWLRQGQEVYLPEQDETVPRLAQLGTYARIVDWNRLDNGLLGITIEGRQKFRLLTSQQQENRLHLAQVEWLPEEPLIPLDEHASELHTLLQQLIEHPHLQRLQLNPEVTDVSHLSCLLCQYLPIAEADKFVLLSEADPLLRLEQLMMILDRFSE